MVRRRWLPPLILLLALGCGLGDGDSDRDSDSDSDSDKPDATSRALADAEAVWLDSGAPFTRFDGGAGSVLLDTGWAPTEIFGAPLQWAIDDHGSFFWVEPPAAAAVDLVARCKPFTFASAPPQVLTLKAGQRVLGTVALAEGWQEVRIPIPADALAPGLNRLGLHFAYSASPAELSDDNQDPRRLTVAFRLLALVPRAVADVDIITASADAFARRTLVLGPGLEASFPLPASSRVRVCLGRVAAADAHSRLHLDLLHPDGTRHQVWAGAARGASGLTTSLATPEVGLSRLCISHRGNASGAANASLGIALPERFLTTRPRPRPAAGEREPHVVIYLIDALRADQIGDNDGELPPGVADFARDAVTFTNAWTASSWTLPAVVSLLTGVYPARHRVVSGEVRLAADGLPTLGAVLGDHGYQTVAISQSLISSDHFGLDRGFDRVFLNNQLNGWTLRSQRVRRYLGQWLVHVWTGERPFFAFIHTVDPHQPYSPPPEYLPRTAEPFLGLERRQARTMIFWREGLGEDPRRVAQLRALYEAEVGHAVREFGRLLDMLAYLGLYDDTMVILLADHGEEFGEHGGFDHGRTVYEELLHVPLMIKFPASRWAGTVIGARVNLVDVVPTVLELVTGEQPSAGLDGLPLTESILGRTVEAGPRPVSAEVSPLPGPYLAAVDYRALAVDQLKCIENMTGVDQFHQPAPRWQVFDLGVDPGEQEPLDPDSTQARQCRTTAQRWWSRLAAGDVADGELTGEDTLDELRALGYIE